MANYLAHRGPRPTRLPQVGDRVRLRNNVKRSAVPEGREDHKSALVVAKMEEGGLRLSRDLNGMIFWHSSDVQVMPRKVRR